MGEMADFYIERMLDGYTHVDSFHNVRYKHDDVYMCKYCGEEIEWHNNKGRWVPLNIGTLERHVCDTIAEFEVEDGYE